MKFSFIHLLCILGVNALASAQTIKQNGLPNNIIDTNKLQTDSVDTTKIKTDSVTTPKLITGAVETAKLATDAVTAVKIITGAVETAKINADAVTTVKIITAAVDTNKLATDSVTTAKILNSAVDTAKIAADSVDTAKILYHDARLRSLSIGNGNTLAGPAALIVNGVLGVATNTPVGRMTVNTGTDENITFKTNTDASLQWVDDANSAYNTGRVYANPLLINPGGDGNVGIGNSNPATVLDVEGAAQFGTAPTKSTFSATGSLSLNANQATLQLGSTFYVGDNRVGIGTTNEPPSATQMYLYRNQNSDHMIHADNDSTGASSQAFWKASAGTVDIDFGARSNGHSDVVGFVWMEDNYPVIIATNGNEKMRILAAGNVGVGTSAPVTKLDVAGAAQFGTAPTKSTFTATTGFMALVSSETITAGAVITADACGGVKIVYAASAVTTDTTNTFTAPAVANTGCCMRVVADRASANITLDANDKFDSAAAGDVVLTAKDAVEVCQTGTYWVQTSALLAN